MILLIKRLLLLTMILTLPGCDWAVGPKSVTLKSLQSSGKLTVLTRNAPTTVYQGRDGLTGFEHDLIRSFAKYIEVEPEFKILPGIGEILESVKRKQGDLAAAGLTRIESREQQFLFGPDYQQVQQQLVCRRGNEIPKDPSQLGDVELTILKDSSYQARLEEISASLPDLRYQLTGDHSTEQLLEQVWQREIECTIADSNIVSINRRYFPELVVAFPVSEVQNLAWVLPNDAGGLQELLAEWYARAELQGTLEILQERYYGHVDLFDYVDTKKFLKRVETRLPRYEKYFRAAGERHQIAWQLLAAQSYQESHWNPRAKSPTGVRGMMMLTLPTAREMGVKSRLNPQQSIEGGARYLARLRASLPPEIEEPDRTWIALAAYNVGLGHILDARDLAEHQYLNPNLWQDLKQVLPLLARKQYYKELKYGYARGYEPVRYVEGIRGFYDLLHNLGSNIEAQNGAAGG